MKPSIHEVKKQHESQLMQLPGVVSVGVGQDAQGQAVIIVGLDGNRPDTAALIPERLETYPVLVRTVGTLKAQ